MDHIVGLTARRGERGKGRLGRKSLRLQGGSGKDLPVGWRGSKQTVSVREVAHRAKVATLASPLYSLTAWEGPRRSVDLA